MKRASRIQMYSWQSFLGTFAMNGPVPDWLATLKTGALLRKRAAKTLSSILPTFYQEYGSGGSAIRLDDSILLTYTESWE
jgi:hypothetical protein